MSPGFTTPLPAALGVLLQPPVLPLRLIQPLPHRTQAALRELISTQITFPSWFFVLVFFLFFWNAEQEGTLQRLVL